MPGRSCWGAQDDIHTPGPDNGKLTLAQLTNLIDPNSSGFSVEFDYLTPDTIIPGDGEGGVHAM